MDLMKLFNINKHLIFRNRPDFGEGRHPSWEKYIRYRILLLSKPTNLLVGTRKTENPLVTLITGKTNVIKFEFFWTFYFESYFCPVSLNLISQCLFRSVVSEDNYLGLTRPLYLTCNLCKNQYDAIIMMETYTEDSR